MIKKAGSLFGADFFTGNRRRLSEKTKGKLTILSASGQLQQSADQTFPFRQDSNFWYLTGVSVPDAILVMYDSDSFLVLPRRPAHVDLWEGALDIDSLSKISGVRLTLNYKEGLAHTKGLIQKADDIYFNTPAPSYVAHYSMHTNPAPKRLFSTLRRFQTDANWQNVRPLLAELRIIKQEPEIAAITKAIDMTGSALEVINNTKIKYEYEAAALLGYEYCRDGGGDHAFPPIVAGGVNAATIHYVANSERINPSDMVLIDTGAAGDMYNADLTRMFAPKNGLSRRQKAVYATVLAVQQHALSLIKPGLSVEDYETSVTQFMGEQLRMLGLINNISSKSIRQYYPHSIGHSLGIDVHDVRSGDMQFREGMVVTVEPGIYIPEESIGVRIEDDVLVTKNGIKNLSDHWLPPGQLLQ